MIQNSTIEERVALLELQVANLDTGLTNLETDLDSVEAEVTIISTEQILQDGRILELEIDSDGEISSVTRSKCAHTI